MKFNNFLNNLLFSVIIGVITVLILVVGSGVLEPIVGMITGREHDFYPEPFWGAFWGAQVIAWVKDYTDHCEAANSASNAVSSPRG